MLICSYDGADDSVAGCTSACTRTSISDDDEHGHGGRRYARAFKLDPGKGEGEGEDADGGSGNVTRRGDHFCLAQINA